VNGIHAEGVLVIPRRAAALVLSAPVVNPILETALEVQRFCRSRRWRFCFIGAIAVQRWASRA
jgi:hypothetical protein